MDLSSRKIIVFNKIDNHVLHVSAEHIERFLSRVKPRLEQLQDKGFDVSYRDKKQEEQEVYDGGNFSKKGGLPMFLLVCSFPRKEQQ